MKRNERLYKCQLCGKDIQKEEVEKDNDGVLFHVEFELDWDGCPEPYPCGPVYLPKNGGQNEKDNNQRHD